MPNSVGNNIYTPASLSLTATQHERDNTSFSSKVVCVRNTTNVMSHCGLKDNSNFPKIAHYIWLGKSDFPSDAISNIIDFSRHNPDYDINLWSDKPQGLKSNIIDRGYSRAFMDKVNIQSPTSLPAEVSAAIARESSDTPYANYAAASDILRLAMLEQHGGIYMDVDVMIRGPLGELNGISHKNKRGILIHNTPGPGGIGEIISNAVIVGKKGHAGFKWMLSLIASTYKGKYFPEDSSYLEDIHEGSPFREHSLSEIMWEKKRADPNARLNMTVHTTGPNVITSFFLENHSIPSFKLQNAEQFGHRESGFQGKWNPSLKSDGYMWSKVSPQVKYQSIDI